MTITNTWIVVAVVAIAGCGGEADSGGDYPKNGSEFCLSASLHECTISLACGGQLFGEANQADCTQSRTGICGYLEQRCDYDRAQGEACIRELQARVAAVDEAEDPAALCGATDQSAEEIGPSCSEAWLNCAFIE